MSPDPKKNRQTAVPASYLVLQKEKSVLLIRRFNTGYEDGKYSLIAGHVDADENFTMALIREAEEEANIILRPENLKVGHVMHRRTPDSYRLDVFFVAKEWQGDLKNLEPHKCDQMEWFDLDGLPEELIPYIGQAINCINKGVFYSEFGW
jgi:8-oxo-dGTP diphosphatase